MQTRWGDVVSLLHLELLAYLLLAVVLGGAIGLEREIRGKAAGLRTNILICVGAALFTRLSIDLSGGSGDPARIAAQVVTGVGFIGAGTILHSRGQVSGLTSAATIWLVAAIGVAVGAGALLEATGTTLVVFLVLAVLRWLEERLRRYGGVTHVTIELDDNPERLTEVERIVRQAGLSIAELRTEDRAGRVLVRMALTGPKHLHEKARLDLLRAHGAYALSLEE